LRALAEELDYLPGEAVLLQRYTGEPLFNRELQILASQKGLRVLSLPGPRRRPASILGPAAGWANEHAALERWIPDIADCDVFLCGPAAWTDGFQRLLFAADVPPDRIHIENFGW
jgi:ferredoxin-NADP reductase